MSVAGHFFPEATVIGINPWVINRHKPTFGEDADAWRPERWLCDRESRRKMDQTNLTVRLTMLLAM
jgi:cytochrome P450